MKIYMADTTKVEVQSADYPEAEALRLCLNYRNIHSDFAGAKLYLLERLAERLCVLSEQMHNAAKLTNAHVKHDMTGKP